MLMVFETASGLFLALIYWVLRGFAWVFRVWGIIVLLNALFILLSQGDLEAVQGIIAAVILWCCAWFAHGAAEFVEYEFTH